MKMRASIMTGVGKPLEVREVELHEPKANEVLVKIRATAVCHSDLNVLEDPTTPVPQVLGHEGAGEVVAVGPNVTTCKPGDHVVLSWVPYCGTCAYCRAGKVNLCEAAFGPMFGGTLMDGTPRMSMDGGPLYHCSLLSTFAEYTVVPEMSCVKVADVPAAIKEMTDGLGVEYAIDCTGNTKVGSMAFQSGRKGSTTVVIGAYPADGTLALPSGSFHRYGKILKGSFYGDVNPFNDFPRIAQLYLDGKYDLDSLIIEKIGLEDINRVFDIFHDPKGKNMGRYVIEFD